MRRSPLGLIIAATIAFAILLRLGFWQLDRLKQTNANRAAIAALSHTPARPIAGVLRDPGRADHARVAIQCGPSFKPPPTTYRYALPDGRVGWRLLTMCGLEGSDFDSVLLDRGLVTRLGGAMAPTPLTFSAPVQVSGILRKLGAKPMLGNDMQSSAGAAPTFRVIDVPAVARIAARAGFRHPAPWYVVVEHETPAPPGLDLAPVTEDTPRDNFGYALTWFGLALALLGVTTAFVARRLRAR